MRTLSESQETISLQGDFITYQLIYSNRSTLSIQVSDGKINVKAPIGLSKCKINSFLLEKQIWILQKIQESNYRNIQLTKNREQCSLSETQKKSLETRYRMLARDYITQRVNYYIVITGGQFSSITIRSQKTRWGSCSSKGTLSFNWRLILAPPIILDYVVVHELCHLTHMNHSKNFWNAVAHAMPDYRTRKKWLKEHGLELSESYTPIPFSNV